jgi:hypothetical protein
MTAKAGGRSVDRMNAADGAIGNDLIVNACIYNALGGYGNSMKSNEIMHASSRRTRNEHTGNVPDRSGAIFLCSGRG